MPRQAGIPLLDLFLTVDQLESALPQAVRDFVDRFAVLDHRALQSPGAIIHHGNLQALDSSLDADSESIDVGIGRLSLPLIHQGLPFQLSVQRQPITNNLEPAADAWQLNLFLSDFILTVDGLEPAIYVPESGTTPRHLLRDTQSSEVRIIGAAVLRLQKNAGSSNIDYVFVDQPDPLDPTLDSGSVATLSFSPPHFFLGSSEIGLSVGQLTFDFSRSYSPPEVLERNQGPSWVGLAIREATVYAPRNLPVVGDLSGGVKDLLIGRPMGVQGEFELQFGRTALDPATFQFRQQPDDDSWAISGSGTARIVTIEASQDEDVLIHAGFTSPAPPADGSLPAGALQNWVAIWTWGNEAPVEADSSSGTIRHGQQLTVEPVEIVRVDGNDRRFNHPPITFRFIAAGDPPSADIILGTDTLENVVHIGGTIEELAKLTLEAKSTAAGNSQFRWSIPAHDIVTDSPIFSPDLRGIFTRRFISLRRALYLDETVEGETGKRRTRIELKLIYRDPDDAVAPEVPTLIGCESGVFDVRDATTALNLSAVEATWDLSDYHGLTEFNQKLEQARLDSAAAAKVVVPADGLAQVVIADGSTPTLHDRHVQVLMEFDDDKVVRWGKEKPAAVVAAKDEQNLTGQLLNWAARYPGAEFLIIGRCDDLNFGDNGPNVHSKNITLAEKRAAKGRQLLTSGADNLTQIANSRVFSRGEHSDWDPGSSRGDQLEETSADGISLTAAAKSEAVGNSALSNGWLIRNREPGQPTWVRHRDQSQTYESTRAEYRRVDIYAIGGTAKPGSEKKDDGKKRRATLRRSYVPASGRVPAAVPASAPAIDYRVKLRFKWDSPTATEWKDAIPTLAEAEFAWTPEQLPLPQVNGNDVGLSREVLTVNAQWLHDARTGFTRTTLGIRSDGDPDGLVSTDQKNLTAALAFGPMLLSGVDANNDVIGSAARVSALIAAAAFADVDLGNNANAHEPLVGDGSKTALIAVEAEAQTRAISDAAEDYQVKVTSDYVCTLHINGGVLGIKTATARPMKIRYKNVGFEFDNSQAGWEKIGLAFDTSSMEIEDAGQWEIDGVLGSLLRIVEISMGRGSLWIEGRIAIALDLGVVEISEAIIRLTFEDGEILPKFELRGFALKADIPNVLEGEGRLRIEDGGLIRAGVDANIIPLGLGADAALALQKVTDDGDPYTFLSLALGVQFSTPLPLAQSGAALYGMKGMFTMNGSRKLPVNDDPIGRELQWWGTPPEQKYKPEKGQYAIGLGVVVGTMPDVSFCFSASGMVVVAFPDPEVILGVDVKVIEVPNTKVSDEGSPEGAITGLIVIDDEAVKVAVSAQYDIPKVLSLKVPFGAYFPYAGEGTFVRLGSDGETAHGRHGEPITLKLLPDTLNVKAWAYLMIEQGGLPALGGDERFSFDGFSVGFGAGWGINWSAGPIKLSASAKVLVGFGTKPLLIKGGVFVAGELDLVVLSISARGELILTYLDPPNSGPKLRLDGKFCGEVDLFFFSIKGCVGVSIGDNINHLEPPAPEPPIASVSLTDRRDRVMGSATTGAIAARPLFDLDDEGINQGATPSENHTVWADTTPVLHFSHYVANGLDPAEQFFSLATPSQPIWFGSNRLKYTYKINGLTLKRHRDGALVEGRSKLLSTWMSAPYRQPDSSGDNNPLPSEHEGPNLKLLDWNPWNWVLNMDDGGEHSAGDPAKEVESLCEPISKPRRACVFGRAAGGAAWHSVFFRQETPAQPPYPSRFYLQGEPAIRSGDRRMVRRDLQTAMTLFSGQIIPGGVKDLPFTIPINSNILERGYSLPTVRRTSDNGVHTMPLPWEGRFDRQLAQPIVTLLVCDAAGQPGSTEKVCTDFAGIPAAGKRLQQTIGKLEIHAINPQQPFILNDSVDASAGRPGNDGLTDIAFRNDGIELRLANPCLQIELHLMKLNKANIALKALDAAGRQVDFDNVTGPESTAQVIRLNAVAGISRVQITGGGNAAVLYKVCCTSVVVAEQPPQDDQNCENFRSLKPRRQPEKMVTHRGFTIKPSKAGDGIALIDAVNQQGQQAVAGQDRSAEIGIPDNGMEITLPKACAAVELWVMLFNNRPVSAVSLNDDGKQLSKDQSPASQKTPHRLLLQAPDGEAISRVIIRGGNNEAVLFRICCRGEKVDRSRCFNFAKAPIGLRPVEKFSHLGVNFIDSKGQRGLRLRDEVDARPNPAKQGRDGIGDLQFSDSGVRIELPVACSEVSIGIMLFAGPVKGEALNALGARIDQQASSTQQNVEQRLTFKGPGITSVVLFGGNNEAVVFEICCTTKGNTAASNQPQGSITHATPFDSQNANNTDNSSTNNAASAAPLAAFITGNVPKAFSPPTVRGIIDTELADGWRGSIVSEKVIDGLSCRVIEYRPQNTSGPWDGFQIQTFPGLNVSLLAVCGTDQVVIESHAVDQTSRATRRNDIADSAGANPSRSRRALLLEPGEEYEIAVEWSYQTWQANEEGTDSPPATPGPSWKPGGTQRFNFAVADEELSARQPQDGLNEHKFDARDLSRELDLVEPFDGRSVHFTNDPLWAHFAAAHVQQLAEKYGRELQLEVRRTDPAPQADLAALAALIAPIVGETDWTSSPIELAPVGYQRLATAIEAAPCLPDESPFRGVSLTGKFKLEPQAMYDFRVIAPRSDGSDAENPVVINATRFTTSRYANPAELLSHLGYPQGEVSPYPVDDILLPADATLPGGGAETSDSLMDELLRAIDAETLPLPSDRPNSYVLWRQTNLGWLIEGLLVDSLESLNRKGAIRHGNRAVIKNRCLLETAKIAGNTLRVHRSSQNWTRVFLKPDTPFSLPAGQHELELRLSSSDGPLSGRRSISHQPAIIEREGF